MQNSGSCLGTHLGVEEGAGGLECELERLEFKGELIAVGALEEASLQLDGALEDVAVDGVEEEHLMKYTN